jgi:hypothetical protein
MGKAELLLHLHKNQRCFASLPPLPAFTVSMPKGGPVYANRALAKISTLFCLHFCIGANFSHTFLLSKVLRRSSVILGNADIDSLTKNLIFDFSKD